MSEQPGSLGWYLTTYGGLQFFFKVNILHFSNYFLNDPTMEVIKKEKEHEAGRTFLKI